MVVTPFTLAFAIAVAAPTQTPLLTGQLVEKVACASDPTQTYTLYLPSAYSTSRQWPLLFVFDPRGRGTMAATIFKDAAERFGWIIASSDNTQSDGPWEPNRRAILAMWPDVLNRYPVDSRRIYAAGFSGGAGVATVLAVTTKRVAGIIAVGAPDSDAADKAPALAWFGAAGRSDFNYLDAKSTDDRMRQAGNPRRLEFFDGPHQWLPPAMAMRAAGWFEALAMKDGSRSRDGQLATQLREADVALAQELEHAGRLTEARSVYASVAETFEGLVDVSEAQAKGKVLDGDARLAAARREEQRADRQERGRENQLGTALVPLHGDDIPMLPFLLSKLQIPSLKRAAGAQGFEAESAQRSLELIFVQTSFYVWRVFEEKKDYGRAALCLEIAATIHPDRPRIWYDLAGARAALRDHRAALTALARAVDEGFNDRRRLETDERFTSLRQNDEFARIVARIG